MQTIQPHELKGLSEQEVELSRQKYGSNSISEQRGKGFFARFFSNLNDPIIRILIGALVVSAFLLLKDGCLSEVLGIGGAILLSTLVSTLSEYGSEKAFRRLQIEGKGEKCRSLRNGKIVLCAMEELAVGDIVYLEAGETVGADGFLVEGEIQVDFSALNGESAERRKIGKEWMDTSFSIESENVLLRGCQITEGVGKMIVKRVGDQTVYGHLAKEIQVDTQDSPLKQKLAHLAGTLSKIGYVSAVFVVLADLIYSFFLSNATLSAIYVAQTLIHALTLGITVIVMAVPEGLPMMITVVLRANMLRMLRSQVLVRKPVGIETAGGIEILFTDKTGTLTCGKPKIQGYHLGSGATFHSFSALPLSLQLTLAQNAFYNTSSSWSEKEAVGGNVTERLLLKESLSRKKEMEGYEKIDFIPFQSSLKYSKAVLRKGKKIVTYWKGAPEHLLPLCKSYLSEDGTIESLPAFGPFEREWKRLSESGDRLLAVVMAEGEGSMETPLTLVALLQIQDAVRREAKGAVSCLQKAGVQVVMITGDHPSTACAVAKKCGILKEKEDTVLTSSQLSQLNDEQVAALLPRLRVVARALPADKSRLVRIAQEKKWVVGMTGDGLNDAPALKSADVGFAMGSGTAVTKEAADIVILDDCISSIAKATLFGRTIFQSIRKFITFQLTMNLCAVLVSMLAPFVGIDTPITVMQMLWINLIMDTLAGLAFAGEAPDPVYMKRKPIMRTTPVLTKSMLLQIGSMGLYTLILCISFLCGAFCRSCQETAHLTAFFTLFVFCGVFCAFHARSGREGVTKGLFQNKLFLMIMVGIVFVQIFMVYYGGNMFRCIPLAPLEVWRVFLLALTVLPVVSIQKGVIRFFLSNRSSLAVKKSLDRKEKI